MGEKHQRYYRLSPSDLLVKSFYLVWDPIVVSTYTSYKQRAPVCNFAFVRENSSATEKQWTNKVRRLRQSSELRVSFLSLIAILKLIKLNCPLNISQGHMTSRDYFK